MSRESHKNPYSLPTVSDEGPNFMRPVVITLDLFLRGHEFVTSPLRILAVDEIRTIDVAI